MTEQASMEACLRLIEVAQKMADDCGAPLVAYLLDVARREALRATSTALPPATF